MKNDEIIKAAKRVAAAHRRARADRRYLRVMGFLVGKKFLFCDEVPPLPSAKISVADALWAAEHVEPRINEVLPAAVLHFPGSFTDAGDLPHDLAEVVKRLRAGDQEGPSFGGTEFGRLKRWAELSLPDRRLVPLRQKRTSKSFRLSQRACAKLAEQSRLLGITETEYIERLLLGGDQGPNREP